MKVNYDMNKDKHEKMLERLEELKDTDACPHGEPCNLINWNECTLCGKHFSGKEDKGNPSPDGFLCNSCFEKSKKIKYKE